MVGDSTFFFLPSTAAILYLCCLFVFSLMGRIFFGGFGGGVVCCY